MSSSSETLPVLQLIRVKGVTGTIVSECWQMQMGRLLSDSGRCADFRAIKAPGKPASV